MQTRARRTLSAAGLGLLACLLAASCADPAARPSFVLVLADDLGWADVGYQGSSFYRTPAIDALAADGLVFPRAYAPSPVCSPSRAGILTGLHPARLQVTAAVDEPRVHAPGPATDGPAEEPVWEPWTRDALPADAPTIASRLGAAGYRTALIGKLHLANDPAALGFQVVRGSSRGGVARSYFQPYGVDDLPVRGDGDEYLTDRLTDEAIRFLEESGDVPFLLFVSHYAPHSPFEAPAELVTEYEARVDPSAPQRNPVYAAMVEHLDRSVGRLREALVLLDLADHTFLLFTSDNGGWEERRAENGRAAYSITSNAPWRSGKGRLYEGGVRVPLVVSGPGIGPGSSSVPVVGLDLAPTLAALAGLEPVESDGLDLSSLLSGRATTLPREALVFHFPHQSLASSVLRGEEKLLHFWIKDRDELYRIDEDPGELTDLVGREPERAAELRALLFAELDRLGAVRPTRNPRYRAGE